MTSDDAENPDAGREHLDVIKEAIDRNSDREWRDYRERYEFVLIDDGLVCITPTDDETATRPIETEADHVVTLDSGAAVDCNCHVARRPHDRGSCRHMRAVDAHPQL